jgi:hypothetical protein
LGKRLTRGFIPNTRFAKLEDLEEHKWLAELFLAELLTT